MASLKDRVVSTESSISSSVILAQECQPTYSNVVSNSSHKSIAAKNSNLDLERDRKFNIVLFGVEESASGSSKLVRIQNDLERVTSVICSLDESIPSSSIRDNFRLGKFQPNYDRPRPILGETQSNIRSCFNIVKEKNSIKPI